MPMFRNILAGIVILIVARLTAVLAFSTFLAQEPFWTALTGGRILAMLFGPGGWAVTLLVAGLLLLAWNTFGKAGKPRTSMLSERDSPEAAGTPARQKRRPGETMQRIAPVAGLLVLAPWIGEYLLGNIPLGELVALPFLVPLYGCGALLIREIARHAGRGYPTILTLGLAYGVIEAGLVDQSLFNTSFEGVQNAGTAYVPVLGISAYNAVGFVVGHAIWSIGIPIAIVEMLTPTRDTAPWLERTGLILTAMFYLLGCWIIFEGLQEREGFMATSGQLIGASVAAIVLVGCAFAIDRQSSLLSGRQAARPLVVAAVTFVSINAFFLRPESWPGVGLGMVVLGVLAGFLWVMAHRRGWGVRHQFAVVAATLPTYAAAGFILTMFLRPDDMLAWTGNALFAFVALALLFITARTVWRGSRRPVQADRTLP